MRIRARATGKFLGDVLCVDSDETEKHGLAVVLGTAAAGVVWGGWKLLRQVFYAASSASSQSFAITGYAMDASGAATLLGHCAHRNRAVPKAGEDYSIYIGEAFPEHSTDLDDELIGKYFSHLYEYLAESLSSRVPDPSRRHHAVLLGVQEGLWALSGCSSVAEMRNRLRSLRLEGVVENELILHVFEAISNAGVNLLGLKNAQEFFSISFDDQKLATRRENLWQRSLESAAEIGR